MSLILVVLAVGHAIRTEYCSLPNSGRSGQEQPTVRNRRRRAGTITRGSSWARQASEVAARGHSAQLGAVEGAREQAPSGSSDPCGRTVLLSHVSVMCQFVTTVPVRDNSGLCGKSTVFNYKIGFGGIRKEGEAPIYQFFKKEQKQAGRHAAHH